MQREDGRGRGMVWYGMKLVQQHQWDVKCRKGFIEALCGWMTGSVYATVS